VRLWAVVAALMLAVPAWAGSGYTPPPSGVEGDGSGVTDAPAFRTALELGTAATTASTAYLAASSDAGDLDYTPADGGDWTNPDPTQVEAGLDALADRMTVAESSLALCQPGSAALTDWTDVGVVSAADRYPYSTGAGVWAYGTATSAGRALLDDADASAQRTTLGLGTAALSATGDFLSSTLTDTWSAVDYVVGRDGQAGSNGWTETNGSHTTGTESGITHHVATGATSTYITKSVSITSASSWEFQVEIYTYASSSETSIAVYDGTRLVWVYGASTGLRDDAVAGVGTDVNPVSNWNTITVRKLGGTDAIVELWVGPRRVNVYLYASAAANATASQLKIGDVIAATSTGFKIRSAKFNIITSSNWNSLPSELFKNTARGR